MVISVVSGEAGVGKTTIVKALYDMANKPMDINYKLRPGESNREIDYVNSDLINCKSNILTKGDKLISQLRKNRRIIKNNEKVILLDSPAITKYNAISSIAISDAALLIVEPTASGAADLKRVVSFCKYSGILMMICINKYDLNKEFSLNIERYIKDNELILVGKVPYHPNLSNPVNELDIKDSKEEFIIRESIKMLFYNIKKCILEGNKK